MSRNLFLVIFLISISFVGSTQVFAQQAPLSIDAQTKENFYEYGDHVSVTGKIKNFDADIHSGHALVYQVFDPNNELVALGQTEPGQFGSFDFNFVAKGDLFLPSGNYSIEMTFNSVSSEISMFLSGSESEINDITSPEILQPQNIEVFAESHDAVTEVIFEVYVIDNVDDNIIPTCKPESGFLFGIGETIVKCTAKDSAGNFAIPVSFSVIVNPPVTSIPSWIKNVAEFWCHDKIDDASFVEAIQYLIDNKIIIVPATSENTGEPQEVPQWVKNNACWWSDDSITQLEFASGIEYLVKEGIIVV